MATTTEHLSTLPSMLERSAEVLRAEVEGLEKKRQELGRFLDIDAEEKKLAGLKAVFAEKTAEHKEKLDKMLSEAKEKAENIVKTAQDKADKLEQEVMARLEDVRAVEGENNRKFSEASKKLDERESALKTFSGELDERKRMLDAEKSSFQKALTETIDSLAKISKG